MFLRTFFALMSFYIRGYFLRKPISFLNLLGQTLGMILILSIVGGPKYIPHALTGSLIALSVGSGIGQYAPDICALYTSKFKDVYVASNVRSGVFMIASAVGITFLHLVQASILIIILSLLFSFDLLKTLLLIIVFLASWTMFISLGFYLALKIKYVVDVMKISGVLMLLLTYFSPVYYSESYIPSPYRYITYLSPTTHISAIYEKIIYSHTYNFTVHIILFFMFMLLFMYLALFKSKWRE